MEQDEFCVTPPPLAACYGTECGRDLGPGTVRSLAGVGEGHAVGL